MEWDNFDSNEDEDFLQEDEDNVDESNVVFQPQNHQILTEKDIHQLQEDDITKVSDFLSISRVSSSILLRHFHWNTDIVGDKWVEDEDGICQTVGLLRKKVVPSDLTCGICFDLCSREKIYSADCGHPFCSECWAGYFSTSINEGPGCLMLRCPDPSCKVSVGDDLINTLASEEDKKKYHRYLVRSYIEGDNKKANKTKWCPAPGCEYAVKLGDVTGSCDVTCRCSNVFCWKCTEESHRPVDCDTVAKWIFKNNDESENTNWILANSKPCPKCKRPIEKNHGCMHMTCKAPCFFEFCWLCLGSWKDHDMRVNSFYLCNGYNEAKRQGRYDEAEQKKEIAKRSLDRYAHYYERWAANNASMEKALVELQKMQTEHLETLNKIFDKPVTELEFITKAWQQIVGCRRVLKWTYALGYYLLEHNDAKKHFFEYMQGEAEAGLEKLHHCVEKELEKFLSRDAVLQEFEEFSTKLKGLTAVTRIQFEKVVEALENGLSDVNYLEESSKKRKLEPGIEERHNSGNWSCEHCTFSNISSFTDCQMCGLPNDGVAYSEDDETDEETQDDEETDE